MSPSFILDPVMQQHAMAVQALIEAHNNTGLTRLEIGRLLEGAAPTDPQARADYDQRVDSQANEGFDRVRMICRAMFDGCFEGWGLIWNRHMGPGERQWHVLAKVIDSFRTPILHWFPAHHIAETAGKEFRTRRRSATRIELTRLRSLEAYARTLPDADDRKRLFSELNSRMNEVEIRCMRLAALNMDSGMTLDDFRQLANPRDRRLQLFAKQTKRYVELQERANKELRDLCEMYEVFKQIIGRDPKLLGEEAGKIDRAKP